MASFVTASPSASAAAETPAKEYRCTNCTKSFSRAEHLHRHALNHDETKGNFTCQRCMAVFRRRDLLGKSEVDLAYDLSIKGHLAHEATLQTDIWHGIKRRTMKQVGKD
jgi:hypothetical protein